eukprot:g3618.t1
MFLFTLLFVVIITNTHARTELVALVPAGTPSSSNLKLQWVNVTYPENVSSANDVRMSIVESNEAESIPDAWYDLNVGNGAQLTGKIFQETMYVLENDGGAPSQAGCCANVLKSIDASGSSSAFELDTIIQNALNVSDAYVSHTFDVSNLYGDKKTPVAFFQVRYEETTLNAYGDAIVAIDLDSKTIVKTKDGELCFKIFQEAGTTEVKDSIFKIQFYDNTASSVKKEQWHGNGVLHFRSEARDMTLLAFTHRMMAEAVVFKDPWTYESTNGGGTILQRFGTPKKWESGDYDDAVFRYFGLETTESAFVSGVHNVFYTASSKTKEMQGKETISLFVNAQDGKSAVYEFQLNLVEDGDDDDDDTVFRTTYISASCSFTAPAQGGTRIIGDGVFLVMSGADHTGLEVVDVNGNSHSQAYTLGTANLYDPFVRIIV